MSLSSNTSASVLPGPWGAGTNLASLGLVVWGVAAQGHVGLTGRHLAALVLLVVAVIAWLTWTGNRVWGWSRVSPVAWVVMGAAGGVLATYAALGVVFVAVAALAAALAWPPERAVLVATVGPLATLLSAWGTGDQVLGITAGSTAAALGGLAMGIARRQAQERATQAALVQVSEARADAEEARAELLAGRNHMARELHDILAHTLSALSLQLEALNAVLEDGPEPAPEVRSQLDAIRRLIREGLDEARGAVRALREDLPPLEDQLSRLAADRHAELRLAGAPRRLSPEVSLVLYRVAQEALTNVAKHAPGAMTEVDLDFGDCDVRLSVCNGPGRPANGSTLLAGGGAGYGLQGIRERVLLVGGKVEAGPAGTGWRVQAEVPA